IGLRYSHSFPFFCLLLCSTVSSSQGINPPIYPPYKTEVFCTYSVTLYIQGIKQTQRQNKEKEKKKKKKKKKQQNKNKQQKRKQKMSKFKSPKVRHKINRYTPIPETIISILKIFVNA